MKKNNSKLKIYNSALLLLLTSTLLPLASFLLLLSSCEKGTEPEIIKPGRRDYTWSVDSIDVPFFFPTDISGTSPTDIWVVGPGGDLDKTIWHYDGKNWSTDGVSRLISPLAVFAIDDVVWIAGGAGIIWKYENEVWTFSAQLKLEGYKKIGFNNIWGSSINDIYAVGVAVAENEHRYTQSIIAHFDGNEWKLIDTKNEKCSFTSIYKEPKTNLYYLSGTSNEQYVPDTSKLYTFKNNQLNRIYESVTELTGLRLTENEILFRFGDKIKYLANGKFSTLLEISDPNYGGGFGGRNKKDLFVGMKDGIMHYNGNNLEYIYNFPKGIKLSLGRTMIFKDDYFQIESSRNYLIHGKLKE